MRKFVQENDITFPIYLDPQHEYWEKLQNRYWPAFYLFDSKGMIRFTDIGETHPGTEAALEMEHRIEELLNK